MLSKARSEEGQSLIQFALIITTLLLFVSLAVDMGNAYSVRRKLQNAADAAALAAAREICLGKTADEARSVANNLLVKNGVDSAKLSGAIKFSDDNYHVAVTAEGQAQSIMGNLLDKNIFPVRATANSACGAAKSACGLWPVAFDLAVYKDAPCGKTLVLWDADNSGISPTCELGGKTRPICDCYDCDAADIGGDDGVIVTDVARGWMDFTDSQDPLYQDDCKDNGCGASELACRVRSDAGSRVVLPACIAGLRGVKASLKDDVNSRSGETVRVPLFDSINCGSTGNCSGKDASSYHITDFGCITVDEWRDITLNPKGGMPKSIKQIKTKAILATKNCTGACMTFCGTTDGVKAEPWELKAASLTK